MRPIVSDEYVTYLSPSLRTHTFEGRPYRNSDRRGATLGHWTPRQNASSPRVRVRPLTGRPCPKDVFCFFCFSPLPRKRVPPPSDFGRNRKHVRITNAISDNRRARGTCAHTRPSFVTVQYIMYTTGAIYMSSSLTRTNKSEISREPVSIIDGKWRWEGTSEVYNTRSHRRPVGFAPVRVIRCVDRYTQHRLPAGRHRARNTLFSVRFIHTPV